MNMSRRTTKIEVSQLVGIHKRDRYTFGLNLIAGRVNAMSNARIAFNLPDFNKTLAIYDEFVNEYESNSGH